MWDIYEKIVKQIYRDSHKFFNLFASLSLYLHKLVKSFIISYEG